MKPSDYLKYWLKMTIPAALLCGVLVGFWHLVSGKDFASGFLGGVLGIGWAFPVLGVVFWAAAKGMGTE